MAIRDKLNQHRFRKIRKVVGPGEMACGYVREDGTPDYFVMPKEATDAEVRAKAFELKHGRPLNSMEERMLEIYDRAEERNPHVPRD